MLFQELGKLKRNWIMTSVIAMAVGVMLIICPAKYVNVVVAGLGYVLMVLATVMVLEFLSSKKTVMNYIWLAVALLTAIFGLTVLFYRDHVMRVLSLVFGIVLLLEGINDLFNAWMYARRAQRKGWVLLILLAVILIGFGILILWNPWFDSPRKLMQVIGGVLLFSSAVGILRVVLTWPFKNV